MHEWGCPTFSVPGSTESFIDLCFVNDHVYRSFASWNICTEVTLSDHKAITVQFGGLIPLTKRPFIRPEVTPVTN